MSGRKTTWGGRWPAALGTPGTVPGVADGAGLTAQGHGRTVPRRAPERVCHCGGQCLLLHGLEQLNKPLFVCEKSSPRLPGGDRATPERAEEQECSSGCSRQARVLQNETRSHGHRLALEEESSL